MLNDTKKQPTVVVGLSGGVDSSLAAALLLEQGYAVIGVYMRNWSEPIKGVEHCPWVQDQLDARRVADQLGIPFYTVNFEQEYKEYVVDTFMADYAAGRTPNPDILCNQYIKFDAFFKYAKSLGADYVATGHYARVIDGRLCRGKDPKKDQSYFLWAMPPQVVPHVLFPIGELLKSEVREEAAKRGLVTAQKKDSQGICFIGQADVRDFLAQHFRNHPGFKPGQVLDANGTVIGEHGGAGFYTLGQRAGVSDITWPDSAHRPILYVVATDIRANTITVGEESQLYHSDLTADSVSWFGSAPEIGAALFAKIRYGQSLVPCVIVQSSDTSVTVRFPDPQRAITPGQSIVLYDGDVVMGGGIISSVIA